mgnify:CR=1 FL=1|jgi:GTPase SAR1 family protein
MVLLKNILKTNNHKVKILIIGDSGVGKTCMLMRFCENTFTINHLTTIGINKIKLKFIANKELILN